MVASALICETEGLGGSVGRGVVSLMLELTYFQIFKDWA